MFALRVALHHLNGIKNQVAANLDRPQLVFTLGDGCVHQGRKARAHGNVDPVAALYHPRRLVGSA